MRSVISVYEISRTANLNYLSIDRSNYVFAVLLTFDSFSHSQFVLLHLPFFVKIALPPEVQLERQRLYDDRRRTASVSAKTDTFYQICQKRKDREPRFGLVSIPSVHAALEAFLRCS